MVPFESFGEFYNAICNINIKDLSKVQENSTVCLIANKHIAHCMWIIPYKNELNEMYRYGDGGTKNANGVTKVEYDVRMVSCLKQCKKRLNRWRIIKFS